MTMYVGPEGFEDLTPSAGQRFGTAIGTGLGQGIQGGLSSGLQMLIKSKVEKMNQAKQLQESFGKIPSSTNAYLKSTKRDAYGTAERDAINSLSQKYLQQGYSNGEAAELATQEYEKLQEQQQPQENESSFNILKNAFESPLTNPLSLLTNPNIAKKGIEFVKNLPKKLFEQKESPELQKSASEKIKTATSVNDFTPGELLSLKTEDIKKLSPKLQQDVEKAISYWYQRSLMTSKAATAPFIGGAVEERARESIDKNLPSPPLIANVSRLLAEVPYLSALGTGSLLAKSLKSAATLGGTKALDETIRTLGTNKPYEFTPVAADTIIGGLFPLGEKIVSHLSKPFRKAVIQEMRSSGKNASEASEELLKRAKKAGVEFGDKKSEKQFSKFIEGEAKSTSKKINKIQKPTSEKPQIREKRIEKEIKTLSKTPIEEYLEVKPVTRGSLLRKETLGPKIEQNTKRINEINKELLSKEGTQLSKAQHELQELKRENYELNHEIKYGHKLPTEESIAAQIEKSERELLNHVLRPTEESTKAIQKNEKMMNGFISKAKENLVKGRLPEKKAQDLFIDINESYLKHYKNLVEDIKTQLKDPNSGLKLTGAGEKLLPILEHRIKGLEKAVATQKQKRNVLASLKGPSGVFTRKLIDDVRGTQKLFNKDLIRTGEKISHAEKNISNVTKKHFEELGNKAAKGSEKEFEAAAQKAGFTKNESAKLKPHLDSLEKELKSEKITPKPSFQKKFRAEINALLSPIKNQIMAGFILGALDEIFKETFGIKIPSIYKQSLFVAVGAGQLLGRRKPILALSAYLSNQISKKARLEFHKEKLHEKKGKDYLTEYERLKNKKGFTSKELKSIREK